MDAGRALLNNAINKIKRGEVKGSTEVVRHVLSLFSDIVGRSRDIEEMVLSMREAALRGISARPTSVMLSNYARDVFEKTYMLVVKSYGFDDLKKELTEYINLLSLRLSKLQEKAAETASRRINNGDVVMTLSYSTSVLKSIEYAVKTQGKSVRVVVAESRPRGEGVYLIKKLDELGVESTLIVDSAMNYFIKGVSKVFVGAEAVAANGALVNKVGTSLLALIARHARVPFYVVAGTYKLSVDTVFGELIELPTGEPGELIDKQELEKIGYPRVLVPLMDVTPPDYITAIVTEKGVIAPQAVPFILKDMYSKWPPAFESIQDIASNILREVEKSEAPR